MPETPINPTPPPDQAQPVTFNAIEHLERLLKVELQVSQINEHLNKSDSFIQTKTSNIQGLKDDIKELDKKIGILDARINAKFNILFALIIPMFATIPGGIVLFFVTK